MPLHDVYTVLMDDREKDPLLFPDNITVLDPNYPPSRKVSKTVGLKVERTRLPTGDYILKSNPNGVVIERKASVDEIAGNIFPGRRRELFIEELERFRDFDHAIILLEGHPLEWSKPTPYQSVPGIVVDGFQRLLLEYGVNLVFLPCGTIPHRRAAGEWAARMLINGAITCPRQLLPSSRISSQNSLPEPSS